MSYLMKEKDSVSFEQLSKDLDFMVRTKSWRSSWRTLVEDKKFIEPVDPSSSMFTAEHKLTQAGKDHASTPEYKEYLKELNFVPQSNEEHQKRIKNRLINAKGREIFHLLCNHGSLTRKELSTLCKVNDRSHQFSYGLQDLRTKNYVEKNDNKFRLTDAAFLDASDRPEPVAVEPEDLAAGKAQIESKTRQGTQAQTSNSAPTKGKKRKRSDDGDQILSRKTVKKVARVSDVGSP
jgi:hypothetical protein